MSNTPAANLSVGYGNGLGPVPAPAGPALDPTLDLTADVTAFQRPTAASPYAATTAVPQATLQAELADVAPVGPAGPAGRGAPGPTGPRRSRSGRTAVLGLLALLLLAAAALAVMSNRRSEGPSLSATEVLARSSAPTPHVDARGRLIGEALEADVTPDDPGTTTPPAPTTTATVVVVTAPPVTAAPAPPATATPPTTATPPEPPTTTKTTLADPPLPKNPVIKTFSHPAKVDCSNPANQVPYIPLSWNVENAAEVTVSIDGPGIYKTYNGATGSDTVPFACSPGTHTYLLTGIGPGGATVTQLVTITKL